MRPKLPVELFRITGNESQSEAIRALHHQHSNMLIIPLLLGNIQPLPLRK